MKDQPQICFRKNIPSAGSSGNCMGGLAGLFEGLLLAAPTDLPGASPVGVGPIPDALESMMGSSRELLDWGSNAGAFDTALIMSS